LGQFKEVTMPNPFHKVKKRAPDVLPEIKSHRTLSIKQSSGYETIARKDFPLKNIQRPRQAEAAWLELLNDMERK
jgi:hypothetical protein